MKKFSVLTIIFLFFFISAKDDKLVIKSSVKFEKHISVSDFAGWEKEFFKGFFDEEQIGSITDENEKPDEEIPGIPKMKKNNRHKNFISRKILRKKENIEKPDVLTKPVEPEIIKNEKETTPVEIIKKPEPVKNTAKKRKQEPVLTEMEVEQFEETPDEMENEVDRSDRIRKMKELLKKRKGKRRIEDRRVY